MLLSVGQAEGRAIGRRADFHQRRLEHAVALGQLHDRFLNALQVFGPAELARFRLAADGLVAHDQGLRGLPGLGRNQGIGHRGRGGQQRDNGPPPPVDDQKSA